MRQNGALYCWPLALVTIVGPVQTKSAQTLSAFARSPMSAHNPSFLHPEAEPKRVILSEGPSTDTESPQAPRFSTSSAQLFGLKDHESLRSSLSRRYGQRISISGAAWRHVVPRGRDARLRFLYVFIATSLAIYFTKYAVRCLVTQRQARHITDKGLPGLEKRMSSAPCYASNYSVAGTVRRLAAGEENGGSRDSPDGVRPRGDSTDWFCQSSEETESGSFRTQTASSTWAVETSGGRKGDKLVQGGNVGAQTMNVSRFLEEHIPPGSRSAEAALLRHIADQVMGLAAASSAALSKTCHSTTCLRQALQLMSETYGMLLEEAGTLESPPSGSGDKTQSVDNPSDSGTPAAREKTSPLEHNFNSHSAERMSGSTSDAKSDEAQPVHAGRPVSLDMQLWRRLDFSLGTIFEAEDAEQDGGDDGDVGIERRSSFFTLSGRSGDDEDDTQPSTLEEAMSIVGMDEGMVGGWNPFSSTTSTSDAWGKFVTDQSDARETAGDDANDVTGSPPRRPSYSEVVKHASRSRSAPPRSTAANGQGMAKRVAGLGQRLTSSGHRQSATSRDVSGGRRHYPSGPRVPGRRPTNRFESIDRSASHRRAGARPSLPSRPPPKPPLPQISKVGFGASGTPVQRGASQGGTPSGSEKRNGGEPSKDVKGQGEDAGQPGASGGPLGGAGGGGRRPGDDERDDDKRKKGKGSSSGGGEKKKEEQEKKAKKERDQREEAKKESKPVDDREARGKEVKQGDGGLSSDSGKGSTGEEAGKKKAKKDRGRRAIEETVTDVTDAGVTSEATGGVPKEAEPQKDSDDRGVHGGGRGGEGPGSAGATETGDGLQHDSGGIGSGSEDRDKSRSETAAREKQVSKRQKSSGGRRKKKGASVAPQTGQTTTGEAPRSAVDSEGGRAGPLAASDKNKAGTDEGGRDAKGDEDGEAATAGPRAGAQHTGEHGGETEVVGETVKVAEADEEGSDAAAQREALRTGARPKTSSAAGRRKQKMNEQHSEQVESISFPVSASGEGHDEQTTQSRGRRRQRMFRHDVRPVAEGVPNSSEAIGGRADGKRDHNVGVSSGVGGKGSEVDEDTPSPFPDVAALVTGLHRKLISAQVEYQRLLERIKGELGGEEFIAIVRSAGFAKRIFSSSEFYFLTKVILLTEETNFQLQALLNVARHLHEKALEQRESDGGDKSKDDPKRAAAKGRAVGAVSRDMEESPFSAVLTAIDKRSVTARKILLELLRADTRFRSLIIARSHLPSLPDFQLPPFPNERGYNPNSKNIVHTSAGVPLRAADPESVVMLLKDEVEQWESQVESVVSAVEAKWWIPPSDPDEARRQQERTAAVFGIASAILSLRVVEVAASRWRRLNDRTPVSDPALQAKVQAALSMLDGFHDEYIQRKDRHFNAYCDSYSATARANVRHPQRRWDPLPNNAHAPDIRGAAAAEVRNVHEAPESMTEDLPDADNLPKTDGKQEADGPTS